MFKRSKGVFVLRKILYTFSTAALLLGGLTACNTDQGASPNRDNDNVQPFGYYSNENNGERGRDGNGERVRDNDGPLTEIMDLNGNGDRNRNNRVGTMNNRNDKNNGNRAKDNRSGIMNRNDQNRRNNPFNDGNPNTMNNKNGHGYADQNYHSHLNDNNHKVQSYGYYNDNGNLVRKISERASKVKNVEDARVIVTDDNVLIAIDTNDNDNRNNVQNDVKKEVKPLVGKRNVNVVTDEGTFTRVRDIDNDIRNGNRRETIDADIKDLFDNIGDTIRAPFTNENRG